MASSWCSRVGAAITAASIWPSSEGGSARAWVLHSAATRLRLAASGIDHGHQLDVGQADELLGVEAAQAAGADDGDVELLHG